MTIKQIVDDVRTVAGSYSEPSFHRDRKRLGIQPLNLGQRGRQYPADAPALILKSRGFETALLPMRPLAPMDTAAARVTNLPTVAALKKARRAAKGKARK